MCKYKKEKNVIFKLIFKIDWQHTAYIVQDGLNSHRTIRYTHTHARTHTYTHIITTHVFDNTLVMIHNWRKCNSIYRLYKKDSPSHFYIISMLSNMRKWTIYIKLSMRDWVPRKKYQWSTHIHIPLIPRKNVPPT